MDRNMLGNVGINNHDVPIECIFSLRRVSVGRTKAQFDAELVAKDARIKAGDTDPDLVAQVKYYKMLSNLYGQNVTLMDSVVAYYNHEITRGNMIEESNLRKCYGPLVKWLENMEKELRRVLGLPSNEFLIMFCSLRRGVQEFLSELKNSVINNPKTYGAVVGGCGGAVILHKYLTAACVTGKLFAKLGLAGCGATCAQVGWVTAFGCGALGGIFLVLAVKTVCHAFGPEQQEVQMEIAHSFQDVQREVEMVKEALVQCNDEDLLSEMRRIAAFWDHFETFNSSIDDNDCPICLNPLREPVLFRGCTGRHFFCKECREAAIAANSGGGRCPVCRAQRP